jgi:hypothetical protein
MPASLKRSLEQADLPGEGTSAGETNHEQASDYYLEMVTIALKILRRAGLTDCHFFNLVAN